MRVLGIDPGYDRLGAAIIERSAGHDTILFSGCFESERSQPLPTRLKHLGNEIASILARYTPDVVAIETLFFNQNQKTAIGVAQMRGVIIYLAREAGCEILEFGPQEVKVAMTGYGKSDKAAVIAMVQRLVVNAPTNALDDEYDAIAVGVTALAHHR